MHDWALGTPDNDWVSMAIPADGSYGIEAGIIYSYPVRCSGGKYEIVQGLEIERLQPRAHGCDRSRTARGTRRHRSCLL